MGPPNDGLVPSTEVHPMERLRYVAGARGLDPPVLVAETVDALLDLSPAPGELVTLCRQLVRRHPKCAPMWWLCSRLLTEASGLDAMDIDRLLTDVDELRHDATSSRLAGSLTGQGTVVVTGSADAGLVAAGLALGGGACVLVIDTGDDADDLGRRLDRSGVPHEFVDAVSTMAAMGRSSVAIVEAVAASAELVLAPLGGGLLAAAAAVTGTPLWVVAGRGRRLPASYVRHIAVATGPNGPASNHRHDRGPSLIEAVPLVGEVRVIGPDGIDDNIPTALSSECRETPELLTPSTPRNPPPEV
ncbi:hypothetical protein BH24ACT5_BH24ACT5_24740 [soil metagenome]